MSTMPVMPRDGNWTVDDLVNGEYQEVCSAVEDEVAHLRLPFPVAVTPSALLR